MNSIKYDPGTRDRMGGFLDDLFGKRISGFIGHDAAMNFPAVNIVEKADFFLLELAAPGLGKEDIDVSVLGDKLTLSADVPEEDVQPAGSVRRREFICQSFRRRFLLPEKVRKEGIEASFENGVLKVVLPKLEERRPEENAKRIAIS